MSARVDRQDRRAAAEVYESPIARIIMGMDICVTRSLACLGNLTSVLEPHAITAEC